MKKSQIIFFTILLILTFSLIVVIYLADQNFLTGGDVVKNLIDLRNTSRDFKIDYQNNLQKIFGDFLAGKSFLNADTVAKLQLLQDLEKNILNLRLPAEYKDLHLNLVIAINKLKTENFREISESRQLLEEMAKKYPWLAPLLNLFIINLY